MNSDMEEGEGRSYTLRYPNVNQMNNPTTNLGISVSNLYRMNNTILSESRMNKLNPNLVNGPCNNPPTGQTPDNIEHPDPEDCELMG